MERRRRASSRFIYPKRELELTATGASPRLSSPAPTALTLNNGRSARDSSLGRPNNGGISPGSHDKLGDW